jgi:hypothetical protein
MVMRIKIGIKSLVLLTLVLSVCTSFVAAQKKQTPAKQSIWQEVKWERWELKFSIPTDLKETTEIEEDKLIPADENFGETRTFERTGGSNAPRFEMSIDLTNWKGEKIKTEYNSGEVELSPEQMLKLDYIGDSGDVKRADSPTLEASYLEIDGLTGVFVIRNMVSGAGKIVKPNKKIVVVWGTYRVFKGNVQRIAVSIEGQGKQLGTMKTIINSLKFNL